MAAAEEEEEVERNGNWGVLPLEGTYIMGNAAELSSVVYDVIEILFMVFTTSTGCPTVRDNSYTPLTFI